MDRTWEKKVSSHNRRLYARAEKGSRVLVSTSRVLRQRERYEACDREERMIVNGKEVSVRPVRVMGTVWYIVLDDSVEGK